jgi:hypothetical protein
MSHHVWPFPPPGGPVPLARQPKPKPQYPDDVPDAPFSF